jgi:hypothetical protein
MLGERCHVIDNDAPTVRRACERMIVYAEHSVPKLLKKHPRYAAHTLLSIVELPSREISLVGRGKRLLLKTCCRPLAGRAALLVLERLDRAPVQLPAALYKYALATHYLIGKSRRDSQSRAA